MGDACLVEIEAFDIGRAPGGDQQVRPFDPFAAVKNDRDAGAGAFDPRDLHVVAQIDAFDAQPREDDRGKFGIVLGEDAESLPHGDACAQPPVRLGHLQSDRPTADHDEMGRQRAVGEHRLVGEVRHAGKAGDRWRRRPRARRQHDPFASDAI